MHEPKLFIMALYAVKPDPECMEVIEKENGRFGYKLQSNDDVYLTHSVAIAPYTDLATSEEEAKQYGLEYALKMWPRKDGWVMHFVGVMMIEKAEMMEMLALVPERPSEVGEEEEIAVQELVM
jgi:hypothetical protein